MSKNDIVCEKKVMGSISRKGSKIDLKPEKNTLRIINLDTHTKTH